MNDTPTTKSKRVIDVSAYDPFHHQDDPDTILHIKGMPPGHATMEDTLAWYREQADLIYDALCDLPQGTLHALIVELLLHHANYYRGSGRGRESHG